MQQIHQHASLPRLLHHQPRSGFHHEPPQLLLLPLQRSLQLSPPRRLLSKPPLALPPRHSPQSHLHSPPQLPQPSQQHEQPPLCSHLPPSPHLSLPLLPPGPILHLSPPPHLLQSPVPTQILLHCELYRLPPQLSPPRHLHSPQQLLQPSQKQQHHPLCSHLHSLPHLLLPLLPLGQPRHLQPPHCSP